MEVGWEKLGAPSWGARAGRDAGWITSSSPSNHERLAQQRIMVHLTLRSAAKADSRGISSTTDQCLPYKTSSAQKQRYQATRTSKLYPLGWA